VRPLRSQGDRDRDHTHVTRSHLNRVFEKGICNVECSLSLSRTHKTHTLTHTQTHTHTHKDITPVYGLVDQWSARVSLNGETLHRLEPGMTRKQKSQNEQLFGQYHPTQRTLNQMNYPRLESSVGVVAIDISPVLVVNSLKKPFCEKKKLTFPYKRAWDTQQESRLWCRPRTRHSFYRDDHVVQVGGFHYSFW
jgi:hypothetical protein